MSEFVTRRTLVAAQGADKYIVRLPDGMRDRIAELAKDSGRSMNSEIIAAIEQYLIAKTDEPSLTSLVERLEAAVKALEARA